MGDGEHRKESFHLRIQQKQTGYRAKGQRSRSRQGSS